MKVFKAFILLCGFIHVAVVAQNSRIKNNLRGEIADGDEIDRENGALVDERSLPADVPRSAGYKSDVWHRFRLGDGVPKRDQRNKREYRVEDNRWAKRGKRDKQGREHRDKSNQLVARGKQVKRDRQYHREYPEKWDEWMKRGELEREDGREIHGEQEERDWQKRNVHRSTSDVATIESILDAIESNVDATERFVDVAESNVDAAESVVDAAESDEDATERFLVAIESDGDAAHSIENAIDRFVFAAESDVDDTESVVDAAESFVDVIKSVVDAIESNVDTAESVVDTTASVVDAAESVVDAAENDVHAAESDVDAAESFVDAIERVVNAMESDVDAAESVVDATESDVGDGRASETDAGGESLRRRPCRKQPSKTERSMNLKGLNGPQTRFNSRPPPAQADKLEPLGEEKLVEPRGELEEAVDAVEEIRTDDEASVRCDSDDGSNRKSQNSAAEREIDQPPEDNPEDVAGEVDQASGSASDGATSRGQIDRQFNADEEPHNLEESLEDDGDFSRATSNGASKLKRADSTQDSVGDEQDIDSKRLRLHGRREGQTGPAVPKRMSGKMGPVDEVGQARRARRERSRRRVGREGLDKGFLHLLVILATMTAGINYFLLYFYINL